MMTKEDFSGTVRSIRERPREDIPAIWCNLIRFRDLVFLQGQLWVEENPAGIYRPLAALVDPQDPVEPKGFWPSISAHPVKASEETRLVSFLSGQGPNDVELIVPERNTARLMDWNRFDEAPEYPVYRNQIHPAVVEAVQEICDTMPARTGSLCAAYLSGSERSSLKSVEKLLDVGCGCGDLIEALLGGNQAGPADWRLCGCGNLFRVPDCGRPAALDCHGIDANPDNVGEAQRRRLANIHFGDGEDVTGLPGDLMYDIMIFCGLLNRQILSREKAERILRKSMTRLRRSGHVIITGYTSCHLTADDLSRIGLAVLRKCFPGCLFLDYNEYHLRQFYVARKDA
ncbi:MAG: class I SAM-dependent methyltransferase [Syntrophaceae bacterium]|nr:class I SAM-dependent methyltransferase [Syntrophaceae bacterium]